VIARDLPLHVLALLVYPGLLLTLLVGAAAEVAVALVVGRAGVRAALQAPFVRLRRAVERPRLLAVPLLAILAATQLAAPFNPVPPVERNLLVAAISLAAATWLVWTRSWSTDGARRTLGAQVCWLVALMAPALVSESLRPQALGAIVVPAALPLKFSAGLLMLLCLPVLLRLLEPDAAEPPGDAGVGRMLLWLPLCGLFVSLFLPPGADDAGSLLRFLGATLATAAVAIAPAAVIVRANGGRVLHPLLLPSFALVVLAIAAVTSVLT
jgi:hypothetical protein